MNKTITIISLNYAPEDSAIGLYSSQMAEYLVENGWEVNVVTGFPYYPQWEIADEYKDKSTWYSEKVNGVNVYRYKQFVPSNPKFSYRIIQIIDFTLGSLFGLKRIKNSDVVLSIIPFTSSAWLGKILAKRLNAKHWVHIQDFEFDAAFESGLTDDNGILKSLSKHLFNLESRILDSATLVSTISNGMLQKLKSKSRSETFFFPNWVDESFIDAKQSKKHPYLDSTKFKVLYSGNIGAKQDWELFKEVVVAFKDDQSIEFVVVGDGGMKIFVEELAKKTDNLSYYPPVPYAELNDLLCATDIHVLFQKQDVIDTVMPSKLLGMFGSSKPSIISGNKESEVALVMKGVDIGVFVSDDLKTNVVQVIRTLQQNQNERLIMGVNARNYVIENFSKITVLKRLQNKLDKL